MAKSRRDASKGPAKKSTQKPKPKPVKTKKVAKPGEIEEMDPTGVGWTIGWGGPIPKK
jgi:hypothetical protein